ncbi:hypothetical protein [Ruminococcus sp.]|uniref:beta strand repeat-containing protein n=1 Tax=Ruminococcus sp. TaxID=41978 RepID=UPI0025DDBEE8|nr:hypothetical protein [Ruminococcus sp.]MBQ8967670.1 hypothetical protein [Ruminococcus sp.]
MKANKKNTQPIKRSRKARITSAVLAATLIMNNLPLNELNGVLSPIGKMFSWFRSTTSISAAAEEITTVDYSPEDFNTIVSHITDNPSTTEYTINSYEQLVYYSKMYYDYADTSTIRDHSTDILNIGFTSATNVDYSGFYSIGTSLKPFRGTIKIADSASSNMNISVPLFNFVDVTAQITNGTASQQLAFTRTASGNAPLFANHVVNTTSTAAEADWKIVLNVFNDGTDDWDYSYSGLIGDIASSSKVKVEFTNNGYTADAIIDVAGSSDVGLFCGTLGANSTLTAILNTGTNTNYTVSTSNGAAGGIVGKMNNSSKLILSGSGFGGITQSVSGTTYVGGIVGEAHDAYIGAVDTETPSSMSITSAFHTTKTTVSGNMAAGYLFGYYEASSDKSISVDSGFTNTVVFAENNAPSKVGAYFGILETTDTVGSIFSFDGGMDTLTESTNFNNVRKSITTQFEITNSVVSEGGVIGTYKTSSLLNTLSISNTYAYNDNVKDVKKYGGAIGTIDDSVAGAYIEISNFYARNPKGKTLSGGLFGVSSLNNGQGTFINIKDYVRIQGGYNACILYEGHQGAVRISGITDLANDFGGSATIAYNRNDTLIYSKGSGSNADGVGDNWKFVRPAANSQVDDIYDWGQVVRLTASDISGDQVVDETNLASGHYVTIPAITTSAIANRADFIRLALYVQLTARNKSAVKFGDETITSAGLLGGSSIITISATSEIDLTGTGITGITRDNGSTGVEFSGTFNGGSQIIKMAVGTAYGYKSNRTTLAFDVNDGTGYTNGRNYRHQYNGLFAILSGATINNVTIDGEVWIRNIGTVLYTGGVGAYIKAGTTAITGVTSDIEIHSSGDGNSAYTGGFISYIAVKDVILNFSGCTGNADIYDNTGNADKGIFFGGFLSGIEDVTGGEVNFTNTCKLGGSFTTESGETTVKYGGLIAYVTNSNNLKEINITSLAIDGLKINANISKKGSAHHGCGGLLGYEWFGGNVTITDLTIGATTAPEITLTSDSTFPNDKMSGLCTFATGYWRVDKLDIQKLTISGGGSTSFGMIVNSATRLKDDAKQNSLYLELTDKTKYTISSDNSKVAISNVGVYDELAAFTHKRGENITVNGASVISINTDSSGSLVKMDGTGCNTYQNQTYYGRNTASAKYNPNSRYYYNLYTIRRNAEKSDAEKLMLWSVYQYANNTIRSLIFKDANDTAIAANTYTLGGDLDMTGYSYYPINYSDNLTFSNISKLKFCNAEIEAAEADTAAKGNTDSYARTTIGTIADHTQHYMMHCGLFLNYTGGSSGTKTLSFGNAVIEGNVGIVNGSGSGFIVCGTLGGVNGATVLKDSNTNTIKLNGAYVNGAYISGDTPSYPYAPMLVNQVLQNTSINLYGVQTTEDDLATADKYKTKQAADTNWSAASSLIGKVGNSDGTTTGIKLDFAKLTLDSRISNENIPEVTISSGANAGTYNNNTAYTNVYKTTRSIFNNSTLLYWFIYNNGCNGTYNYTVDEDWASSGNDHPHNVTYGQEVTYSIDNGTLNSDGTVEKSDSEQKYYSASRPYLTNPLYKNFYEDDNNGYYDFSKSVFRPYVGGYDTMDGTAHVTKYRELEVNLTVANLDVGCGSYNDPYIINDPDQLVTLAKILRGDSVNSKFEVRLPHADNSYLTTGTGYSTTSYGDLNLKWCEGSDKTCKTTFSPDGTLYTSNDTSKSGNKYTDVVVRSYLAGAYYQITADLTLPAKFAGLGAGDQGRYAFRGVIVGKEGSYSNLDGTEGTQTRYPRITNKSANPLILTSNGSVIKNVILKVDNVTHSFEQTSPESATFQYNGGCASYGALIGKIMGGDNIIDNVPLTYNNTTFTMGNGSWVVPVGGYVGVVVNGGLFFRNMTTDKTGLSSGVSFLDDSNSISGILTSNKYLYVNPIIGRVINGYAVYENTATTTTADSAMANGTKNYYISGLDTSNAKLEVTSDSKVNIKNAQAMFVLGAIVNSGTGSTSSSTDKASISYNKADFKSTHIGTYEDVGCKNTKTISTVCDSAIFNTSSYTEVKVGDAKFTPYIIYKYTEGSGDARSLTISGNSYAVTMSGSTWSMPAGFRGVGGGYTEDNKSYQLGIASLDGGSTAITYNILYNTYEYGYENYRTGYDTTNSVVYGFGLFNYLNSGANCEIKDLTLNGSVKTDVIDHSTGNRYGLTTNSTRTYYPNAGMLAGIKNNANALTLSGITIANSGDGVWSMQNSGSLIGQIAGNGKVTINTVTATPVKVHGTHNVGGLIGICKSPLEIDGLTVGIDTIVLEYGYDSITDSNISGVIGYFSNASGCTIRNTAVSKNGSGSMTIVQSAAKVGPYEKHAGGVIIGTAQKGVTIADCTINDVSVQGGRAGGVVGQFNETNSSASFTNVHLNGNSTGTGTPAKIEHSKGDTGVGGFVGLNHNTILTIDNCSIKNYTLDSSNRFCGGVIGQMHQYSKVRLTNYYMTDCTFTSSSNDVGGIIGQMSQNESELLGYNIALNNITATNKYSADIVGWLDGKTVKVVGFSRNNTPPLNSDTENKICANTIRCKQTVLPNGGYVIFSNYGGVGYNGNLSTDKPMLGDSDATMVNTAAPYATVNPSLNIINGDLLLTGDGISANVSSIPVKTILSDMNGTSVTKRYDVTSSKSTFESFLNSASYATGTLSNISTFKTEWRGSSADTLTQDFAVLVLEDSSHKRANDMITSYIKLLTNCESFNFSTPQSNIYNINIYKMQLNNGAFVKTDTANLKRESTSVNTNTRYYMDGNSTDIDSAESLPTFSLIDISFYDPTNTENIAYHLYIPVFVKKMLKYDFRIATGSGTNYERQWYYDNNRFEKPIVENLGSPATIYFSYTYLRTKDEWQNAVNYGDKLLANYSTKKLNITLQGNPGTPIDSSTVLVLVDRNNYDKHYYSTFGSAVSNGVLNLSSFKSNIDGTGDNFTPVFFNNYLTLTASEDTNGKFKKLEGTYADDAAAVEAGADIKATDGYYAAIGDDEVYDGTRYSLTVTTENDATGYVPMEESYYISFFTPSATAIQFSDYQINSGEISGYSSPARAGIWQAAHMVFGNLFTQSNVTITPNYSGNDSAEISSLNTHVNARLSAQITLDNTAKSELGTIMSDPSIEVYQSFLVYATKHDQASTVKAIASDATISGKYSINGVAGAEKTQNITGTVGTAYIEVKTGQSIKSQLLADGATIESDISINYSTPDSRTTQFPQSSNHGSDYYTEYSCNSKVGYDPNSTALSKNTMSATVANTMYYYITSVDYAKLEYNAYAEDNAPYGQLGINASDLDGDTSPVEVRTRATYNLSPIASDVNYSNYEYVKCEFELKQKLPNSDDYSDPLAISNYLSGVVVDDDTLAVAYKTPKETSNGTTKYTFVFPRSALENTTTHILYIPITFYVYTGSDDFEKNPSRLYANYEVDVTVQLIANEADWNNESKVWDKSKCSKYIKYTNARLYTKYIRTSEGSNG